MYTNYHLILLAFILSSCGRDCCSSINSFSGWVPFVYLLIKCVFISKLISFAVSVIIVIISIAAKRRSYLIGLYGCLQLKHSKIKLKVFLNAKYSNFCFNSKWWQAGSQCESKSSSGGTQRRAIKTIYTLPLPQPHSKLNSN